MGKIPELAPQSLLGNQQEAFAPLWHWRTLTLPAVWCFVAITAAYAIVEHRSDMAAICLVFALTGIVLLAVGMDAARRHIAATAAALASAYLVIAIAVALVWPDAYLLLPWLGLMALMLCAPYFRARTLRALAVVAWFLCTGLTTLAFLHRTNTTPPWLLVLAVCNGLFNVFALLLQFSERLFKTMLTAWRVDKEQSFLAEAGEALAESLDLHTTLSTAARLAVPFLADGCVIDVLKEDGTLERVALEHVGKGSTQVPLSDVQPFTPRFDRHPEHPVIRAIKTGRSILLRDDAALQRMVISGEHYAFLTRLNIRSLLAVPFAAHGRILGAVLLCTFGDTPLFSENTIVVAEELARRVGLCIDNARLYREARAAIRLRDDFFSIASHELRTPLTTLRLQMDGALRLLQTREGDRERLVRRITVAQQQASRLEALIRALLDVNSVTARAALVDNRRCDLRALAREVVDRFQEEAARAGSALNLQAPGEVWGAWDTVRLDQVMTNLVTNAIKYGAGKPVDVQLMADAQHAYFSVADHGIGIASEDQQRIFDRFERAVSTRNYGGFGLGLWVARTLVTAAGGEISVASKPKQGATFTVTLPRNVTAMNVGPPDVTASHVPPQASMGSH